MEREEFSLAEAWERVGDLYGWIVSLFGAPVAIAARLLLVRQRRREILEWLGPVEALARRLLLLKALSLPTPNHPPPKTFPGRIAATFADRPRADIDADSTNWRVRFCVMPHGALRRKSEGEIRTNPRGNDINYNAVPLARRLEALRRVLENPCPALARLARLLATQRETIAAAFRPYRPRATCVHFALPAAQREIDLALNTS